MERKKINYAINKGVEICRVFFKRDAISFLIFFLFGYLLGLMKIHEFIFNKFDPISIKSKIIPFVHYLGNITPNAEFLSDVASFEAVIIALAIPLSFEIISRISERYQSEVISRKFDQERIIKWLPLLLIVNIVIVIVLRFIIDENSNSVGWKIFAWIVLISFVVIAFLLYSFISRMKEYMLESNVVKKLLDDARKTIER